MYSDFLLYLKAVFLTRRAESFMQMLLCTGQNMVYTSTWKPDPLFGNNNDGDVFCWLHLDF